MFPNDEIVSNFKDTRQESVLTSIGTSLTNDLIGHSPWKVISTNQKGPHLSALDYATSYAALARCTFSPYVRTRTCTHADISSPPKLPDLSPRIAVGRCGSVVHSQRLVLNLSLMPEERIFILTWYSCTPYSLVYFHIIYRIIYHWPGGISCFF